MQPLFYSNGSAFQLAPREAHFPKPEAPCLEETMLMSYSFWEFEISQQLLANQRYLQGIFEGRQS